MESSKYLCHCFEMGAGDFEGGSVLMGPMISEIYIYKQTVEKTCRDLLQLKKITYFEQYNSRVNACSWLTDYYLGR